MNLKAKTGLSFYEIAAATGHGSFWFFFRARDLILIAVKI